MALHPASVGMGLMLNRKQKGKDMVNKIEIRPADGRKSFYGKANMVQYEGTVYWTVRSYGADVALMRKTEEVSIAFRPRSLSGRPRRGHPLRRA